MITRRQFLAAAGLSLAGVAGLGSYAFGIEPGLRLRTQRWSVSPPGWPSGLNLRLALVADIHACKPWMNTRRIQSIVEATHALEPDAIFLLGDYAAGHNFVTGEVHSRDWSAALAPLSAPLGVHAVMGNHDWWSDRTAQASGKGPVYGHRALEAVGIPVYENDAVRLAKDGRPFWLAGLGDQFALLPGRGGRRGWRGVDDLDGTLAKIADDAPIILMAHEPDIFPRVPERVALTLSGHTHGGQVRLFGWSPIVPSRFGNRFAYGHIREQRRPDLRPRDLIVSGGLGCSVAPVRFGVPPEITLIEISAPASSRSSHGSRSSVASAA